MKVLFFAAHPDDLDFYCVGVIRKLLKLGANIYAIYATKGQIGNPRREFWGERLAKIRVQETLKAAKIIGLKKENIIFLDFIDGEVSKRFNNKSVQMLINWIQKIKPQVIFAPEGRKFSWYRHLDHIFLGDLVFEVCKRIYKPILYHYHSRKSNTYFDVSNSLTDKSQKVFESQYHMANSEFAGKVQFPGLKLSITFIRIIKRFYGLLRRTKYISAYRKVIY